MGVADIDPLPDAGAYVEPRGLERADRRSRHRRHRHAQRLRGGARHVPSARRSRDTTSFREFPDWVERHRARARGPQGRDVLHRRHPLREGDRLCALARLRRGLPSQGRHPEISGRGAGRARACGRASASSSTSASRSRMGWRGRGRALPRLPPSADARATAVAALSRRHFLRALPSTAAARRTAPAMPSASARSTCRSARRAAAYRQLSAGRRTSRRASL